MRLRPSGGWSGPDISASERERERDGLVINDLPTVESKAPSHFGGVGPPSECAPRAPRPGQGLQHTRYTLWCTPQPWRSLSSRLRPCQFIIGLSLSRGVTRAVGVLFCRAFLSAHPRLLGGPEIIPGRDGRRRLRMGAGIESRRCPGARLALPPSFPVWGVGPAAPRDLRRDRGHPRVGGALLH